MRYDPLIVHYLARELEARLAGAEARTLRLDPATRVAALETTAGTLVLELHPSRGGIAIGATPAAATVVPLHRRSTVRRVSAPADERLLVVELAGGPPSRIHRLVVELLTNQWNVVALDGTGETGGGGGGGGGRIVAALWPRDAGGRRLRAGATYRPPPASARAGAAAPVPAREWLELLGEVAPPLRAAELIARVAWTSPLNAAAILGAAARTPDAPELEAAHGRYLALAALGAEAPCLLELEGGPQPYPLPLPGLDARPTPSLLDALAQATGLASPGTAAPGAGAPPAPAVTPELVARVRRRRRALEARAQRLDAQGAGAREEAALLRARGDVLLANLQAVHRGMAQVTLPAFAGGELTIELDPALAPAENATRLYEEARRRERAATRVPALIAGVEAERARLAEALRRAQAADAGAAEREALAEAVGPGAGGRGGPGGLAGTGAAAAAEEALPYRRYRTSGGLEVRVGRNRRANDALTFHHSSPGDIWLHARDAGGAHVVLRWADAEGNPPRRDLAEAAVLAALHSKARTSGTVAVDWTRRKYVRKPRKAPPGLVLPERVKTIFVEPDTALEKKLRARS